MEEKSTGKPKKGIIICRVSTTEQAKRGTSLESQEVWAKGKATELNVEIIKTIREDISGKKFPKENYEFIVKLVEARGITHVFVYSFDRLSRSFSYGVMLVQLLWDRSVKIVTSTFMPNSNKSNERLQVWLSLLFAEMEHGGIHERTRRGITTKLKSGIYPLPWLPFGYERIDLKISLKSEYKPVIRFIFEVFIEVKCYNETAKRVNEKYGKEMVFELKGRDISKIIGDKIYLGYLRWGGMLFGEGDENRSRKELKAVNEETFEKARVVAKQISHRYSRACSSPVEKLTEDYGMEPVIEVLNLKTPCLKCGSVETQKNGKERTTGGLIQLKYICKKCGHQFRSSTTKQVKKIRELTSSRCRNCNSATLIVEENGSGFWRVVCKKCGYTIPLWEYCDRHHKEESHQNPRKKRKRKRRFDAKIESFA